MLAVTVSFASGPKNYEDVFELEERNVRRRGKEKKGRSAERRKKEWRLRQRGAGKGREWSGVELN